jgi:hypothetical protein
MAVKKKAAKATKTAPKKAAPAKRACGGAKAAPAEKKKTQVGSVYQCKVCGLVVSVIDECGCVEACDLICCEEAMKPKKTKAA